MTFWQAYQRSAWIFVQAILLLLPPAAIGLLGAYLLWGGHYILVVLFLFTALLVILGIQARGMQRRGR